MGRQLLFCVETNKKCNSDWMYINRTIQQFYTENNEIRRKPIYMGGKMKYKDNSVLHDIEKQRKKYAKAGETIVIYCIDTDDWDKNADQCKEFGDIINYCQRNNYDMIWFCRDVEHVYWGEQVSDSEKQVKAEQYLRQNKITKTDTERLQVESPRLKSSNILLVLDRYMERAR